MRWLEWDLRDHISDKTQGLYKNVLRDEAISTENKKDAMIKYLLLTEHKQFKKL